MKKIYLVSLILSLFTLGIQAQEEQLPAFPGAEGFGKYVTGGRGGDVYHVTTIEDNGDNSNPIEGSLRWAVRKSGTRTIVFDVSGTIMLKSELKITNGNLTIAGQTAPGDGICVANYPFVISANNIIIRFLRFRLGNEALKENPSAHEGDGLGGMDRQNLIIDHCSVSWSIDECLSVYGSKNFTVQWCIASHSLVKAGHSKGDHGYGGNWGGSGASYHHNFMTNHGSRTPRFGPRPGTQKDERMDFRNNVIYNYGGNAIYGGEGMNVNAVYNYFKPGKATPTGNKGKRIAKIDARTFDYCVDKAKTAANLHNAVPGTSSVTQGYISYQFSEYGYPTIRVYMPEDKEYISCPVDMDNATFDFKGTTVKIGTNDWWPMVHKYGTFFIEGNVNSLYPDVAEDNWANGVYNQMAATECDKVYPGKDNEVKNSLRIDHPIEFAEVTTHTAEDAYERVLDYVGASLHRDEYDRMLIDECREGTTLFTSNGLIDSQDQVVYADGTTGWPALESLEAPEDSDGDGIPDDWEMDNGLDPNDPEDGNAIAESGYTNLEEYINSLVAHIMEAGMEGGMPLSGWQTIANPNAGVTQLPFDMTAGPKDGKIYTLTGVEVKGSLAPGIYIRDGKKFVVK